MKIEEQVCSFELAKKLKELGIEQKSLWYWCPCPTSYQYENIKNDLKRHKEGHKSQICSAFTVAELGKMLPERFRTTRDTNKFYCTHENDEEIPVFEDKTEANARAKTVIYLIENGYLEKYKIVKDELKDIVEIAKQIATEGHKGQKRWDGRDYITHPEAVAKLVNNPELKIVAWLLTHNLSDLKNGSMRDKYMLARYVLSVVDEE